MNILPAPGLHRGVPEHVYRQWAAISQSDLKTQPTALHLRHAMENRKPPTPQMRLGTVMHAAMLEPARLPELVIVGPDASRNSREWRDWAANQPAESVLLQPDEYSDLAATVDAMATALWRHPAASALLREAGESELAVRWDLEDGTPCKGRVDRAPSAMDVLVDLKTTASAAPDLFARSAATYGYDIQAAFYTDGWERATGERRGFVIVAVESAPPHGVAVYSMEDWLSVGRTRYRRSLDAIVEARKTGVWQGYAETVETLRVPHWLLREAEITEHIEGDASAFAGSNA